MQSRQNITKDFQKDISSAQIEISALLSASLLSQQAAAEAIFSQVPTRKRAEMLCEYTCPKPALQHMTVTAPALGSDLPPLRPLPCPLFPSSLSPAFSHLAFSSN